MAAVAAMLRIAVRRYAQLLTLFLIPASKADNRVDGRPITGSEEEKVVGEGDQGWLEGSCLWGWRVGESDAFHGEGWKSRYSFVPHLS